MEAHGNPCLIVDYILFQYLRLFDIGHILWLSQERLARLEKQILFGRMAVAKPPFTEEDLPWSIARLIQGTPSAPLG
jgi:hypothetical protein